MEHLRTGCPFFCSVLKLLPKRIEGDQMSAKSNRQSLIRTILEKNNVSSQDHLGGILSDQGVRCTQATLSRDLREMGVSRVHGPSGHVYKLHPNTQSIHALKSVIGMEILGVSHNNSLVVIRTLAGRAQGVAAFLDDMDLSDILGTVAGDDTIFIAPSHTNHCDALVATINAIAKGEQEHTS